MFCLMFCFSDFRLLVLRRTKMAHLWCFSQSFERLENIALNMINGSVIIFLLVFERKLGIFSSFGLDFLSKLIGQSILHQELVFFFGKIILETREQGLEELLFFQFEFDQLMGSQTIDGLERFDMIGMQHKKSNLVYFFILLLLK